MTVRMGVIEDFDNLSKDAQEYLKRRVEGVKMGVVEELSVMMGNAFASLVLFLFLFEALLFILIAVVVVLSRVVDVVVAMLIAGALLVVLAAVIYFLRERIFTDGIVRHLCRLFSLRKEAGDEK
ncbi:MAG: hypothetical protein J6V27_03030 [Alistipes sp.]|nr:hypothetical protein [Alistipes sp.]